MANKQNSTGKIITVIVAILVIAALVRNCSKTSSYDGTHRSDADMNRLR